MSRAVLNLFVFVISVAAIVFMLNKDYKMSVGIDRNNLDMNVRPQDDFYEFATAGWRRNNPLTGEYARFGAFDKLHEQVLKQVQDLILDAARNPKNDLERKIGTIYNESLDWDKRNRDGVKPVYETFSEIDSIKNMAGFLGKMQKTSSPFWGEIIDADAKDSKHYIFGIVQGGIGLPRDYMLDDDTKARDIRAAYQKYMSDVFNMFGIKDAKAKDVYELEMEMAKSFYPKEKLRDPIANYHKFSYAEFVKKFSDFDWDSYFCARGIKPESFDVGQIEPFQKSLKMLGTKDDNVLHAYLKWVVANGAMQVLGDEQYDLYFSFYGKKMSGKEERRPKWKDAVYVTEDVLGEVIGQIYVKKYFPTEAKNRMVQMVENLRSAYSDRIRNLEWMSEETKEKALVKLGAFGVKIGYPDKWRDYSKLEIKGDSLYADLKRTSLFEDDFWIKKLEEKNVDRTIWYMDPQEVNAYYDPTKNEICFPAGILQPPFFDMNADDAFNYGAIGSVIGHEMTHGFDDSGRHFDSDGNMVNWWTKKDEENFIARAAVMKDFFNKIEVLPGQNANGEFTLGENLADYGGLTISFDAYRRTAGGKTGEFTPDQRFFIAYAGCETQNIRDDEIIKLTKTNEHSLSKWRVNGILPHIDAWNNAFNVKDGDRMFVPQKNRCKLW